MTLTCNVIKDLLPLYVEDLLNEDSIVFVEQHLQSCEECRHELELVRQSVILPIETNPAPFITIQKNIQKKKRQIGIFSCLLTLFLTLVIGGFLTAPNYLPYQQENVQLNTTENGLVVAQFSDTVANFQVEKQLTKDGLNYIYHITAWNNSWNQLFPSKQRKNTILNPNSEKIKAVYYYPGNDYQDQLIYGDTPYLDGSVTTLPRLVLAYYLVGAFLLMIINGILAIVLRDKKWATIFKHIFLISVSYLLSHLLIKGLSTTSYSAARDFYLICLLTGVLYGGYLLLNPLFSTKKT